MNKTKTKTTKKAAPKKHYRQIKVGKTTFPTTSQAIRNKLLNKGVLNDTKAYQKIAAECEVTYPLVYQLAQELLKGVSVQLNRKKQSFDNVIDAAVALSKTKVYSTRELAGALHVSVPCIKTIAQRKRLKLDD